MNLNDGKLAGLVVIIILMIGVIVSFKKRKGNMVSLSEKAAKNIKLQEEIIYGGTLKYSREESLKRGYRLSKNVHHVNFKRPVHLKPIGSDLLSGMVNARGNIQDFNYQKAISTWIPLVRLFEYGDFKNATLKVYVERVNGEVSAIRDTTAVYNFKADLTAYVGEFIFINFNRVNEDIKVNYILKY